ncbi:hypothetical protein, unknown function [Leishmania tarentolae]|uniref:Uncharacterized protein n=1 Tax=Leishmania tarentolae TaxID=5689 RepID=A0A640KDV2_LEITA|nr:hypothetical protein, unknown function [Leishmania tarentolae]
MALFLSALLPAQRRLVSLLLALLALLTGATPLNNAGVPLTIAARAFPECSAYADYFPHFRTTTHCIVKDLCVTSKHCCKDIHERDLSQCLDITAFSCNISAVCTADAAAASSRSPSTRRWFPETQDGGASLLCCRAEVTTTEAPAVPPLDSWSSEAVSHHSGVLPEFMCDDTTAAACTVLSRLPPIIRGFCQNDLLNMYTDAYLYDNIPRICCQYVPDGPLGNDTSGSANAGKEACGLKLLDLPRRGEYHCSLDMRSTARICCNGRIEYDTSKRNDSGSATSPSESLVFKYISSKCLFDPGHNGNSVSSPVMSMAQLRIVPLLLVMVVLLCV